MADAEMLNICIVSRRYPLIENAGEGSFLFPIARALVRQGHSVTILSSRKKGGREAFEVDGLKAYFLGDGLSSDRFSELVLRKFEQLHREKPFHLLHSLDASGFEVGRQRKRLGVAVVYDVDATHLSDVYSLLGLSQESLGSLLTTSWRVAKKFVSTYWSSDRKLLKTADAVFVHSPEQRVILERYYLYPDQRIYTVPFGLDIDDLSLREKSQELMKKLGIPTSAQVVVTVTDMAEQEEMSNLLWAFERVAVKKPTARLLVIGTGPRLREIEFEMLQLALGSRVLFVGDVARNQLADYLALADVFVSLSARSSAMAQSLLEAMAQRKVIVGSEISPLAHVVEDGIDGFLIRPADTFTLSELLVQVFNQQIPIEKVGDSARAKILNLFDSEKMVQQTLRAYSQARQRFVTARSGWISLAWPVRSQ
jgi:1,2-diacylglycerol 3-alpha-glucosyltransferase